jgi:hypothetical protein
MVPALTFPPKLFTKENPCKTKLSASPVNYEQDSDTNWTIEDLLCLVLLVCFLDGVD